MSWLAHLLFDKRLRPMYPYFFHVRTHLSESRPSKKPPTADVSPVKRGYDIAE